MEFIILFQIIVLIFSVVIHEVSHGYIAEELGDPTARNLGRLTLNPIKHIDPFGSIILPLLMSLIPGGIILGWAKPVPYNPLNLKDPKKGGALIAAAGPASNLIVAFIFAIFYRLFMYVPSVSGALLTLEPLFASIVMINIMLAIFNLVPIPPLDGSKILFAFIPKKYEHLADAFERYGFFVLMIFIFLGVEFLSPVVRFLYRLFIGF
ncbi:MAG: site-2 protease family protein [Patescibacteria group bacterium]